MAWLEGTLEEINPRKPITSVEYGYGWKIEYGEFISKMANMFYKTEKPKEIIEFDYIVSKCKEKNFFPDCEITLVGNFARVLGVVDGFVLILLKPDIILERIKRNNIIAGKIIQRVEIFLKSVKIKYVFSHVRDVRIL